MFAYLYLVITLLALSFALGLWGNYPFGKTIGISYVLLTFLTLIAEAIGQLSMLPIITYLLIFLLWLVIILYSLCGRFPFKERIKQFLSPSILIFLCVFLYLSFVLSNTSLSNIDDFHHWGAVVKDAIRLDKFYVPHDQFVLYRNNAYPPFTSFLAIAFNIFLGSYQESHSLLALSSFCFVLFLPLFDQSRWNKKGFYHGVLGTLLTFFLLLCVYNVEKMNSDIFIFNSTYPDWLLSIMAASLYYQLIHFRYHKEDYFHFLVMSIAFVFIKTIAIFLYFPILLTFIIKVAEKKAWNTKMIWRFLMAVFVVVILYHFWQSVVDHQTSLLQREWNLLRRLFTSGAEDEKLILSNMWAASWGIPLIKSPLPFAYFPLVLIISISLLLSSLFLKKNSTVQNISVLYLAGSIVYFAIMVYNYAYRFAYSERVGLAMYGRYGQTYTYLGMILLFLWLWDIAYQFKTKILLVMVTLLLIEPRSISSLLPHSQKNYVYSEVREKLPDWIEENYHGEKMIVLTRTKVEPKVFVRYMFGEYGQNLEYVTDYTNLYDILQTASYFYVADFDQEFYEQFWQLYTEFPLHNNTIYRVVPDWDGLDFEFAISMDQVE